MCVSCGCGMVNEDHGDSRNITLNNLQEAAEAAGVTVDDVVSNMQDATLTSGEEAAGQEQEPARMGRAEEER